MMKSRDIDSTWPNHRLERTALGAQVCMTTTTSTLLSLRADASRRGRSAVGR